MKSIIQALLLSARQSFSWADVVFCELLHYFMKVGDLGRLEECFKPQEIASRDSLCNNAMKE